jgi:type II secretory pathway pseudopilin PulG
MKTRPSSAFTLIETITAMAIILVLTGLVISISGYVTRKGSQSRAQGEMAMLGAAAESYKADSGGYPRDVESTEEESNTDRLSPKKHFIATSEEYEKASRFLYKQLTGDKEGEQKDSDPDGVPDDGEPRYLKEFDPKILKVKKDDNNKIVEVKFFQDPFGYSYGYSTAAAAKEQKFQAEVKKDPKASRPTGDAMPGFNSASYDLWSTGGSKPGSNPTDAKAKDLEWAKWIKNW